MLQISTAADCPLIRLDEGMFSLTSHSTASRQGNSPRPLTKPVISCNMGVQNSNMVTSTLTLSKHGFSFYIFQSCSKE